MAVLRPPFGLADTALGGPDRLIRLPDRYRDVPTPAGVARFEGARLFLAEVLPAAGQPDFALAWPGEGSARVVDLLPADAAALGVDQLVEVSLLPFALADALLAMPGGVPTFYFGYAAPPAYPAGDSLIRPGDPPIRIARALFGILFQDRVALAPWGASERLAGALQATRPADAALWAGWADRLATRRAVRLLDGQGQPLVGQSVSVAIADAVGTTLTTSTGISNDAGEVLNLALPAAGQTGTLRWQSGAALPVMALADARSDAVPGANGLPLPPGYSGGHVQLLDLAAWFAPNLHDDPAGAALGARYRLGSRMEPLVDGIPVFTRVLADLERAKGPGGAAHFAGWAFTDFAMRPGDEATSLFAVSQQLKAAGGDVRILVAQFLQASDASLDVLSEEIALIYAVLAAIGTQTAFATVPRSYTGAAGLAVWALLGGVALVAYLTKLGDGQAVGKTLREVTEQTAPAFFDKLATLNDAQFAALRSPHPVTLADNPVSSPIPLPDGRSLSDLQDRWGVFHQKIQLIRYADGGAPDPAGGHVAYIGGIDVNQNRVDTPGHHGAGYRAPGTVTAPVASPFHDVHCRITGPAASEVFAAFAARYEADAHGPPPTATPAPADLGTPGRDIVQVAQTAFRPAPGSGSTGFAWAPQGNKTTHDTIIAAIRAAREHIYIEEQYMVPDDEYIEALIGAAAHCQRLIIVLPSFLEIFFGDRRRGEMFDRMAMAWGQRLLIGTPMRRPVLKATGRAASEGRFSLLAAIGASDSILFVGPLARVPKGAFFLWIDGELMYATGSTAVTGPDGSPARQLDVLRGGLGTAERWCPNPRPHPAGAPVTLSQPTGIFVHAKIMMVDDLFVSIGSTNINRRGFFHDGEINAFAIPQDLKGAADNPARDLRTRLWAEQLGLAPDMGAALLADPIAGFELFRRSHYQGNRFVPLNQLAVPVPTLAQLPELFEILPAAVRQVLQFGLQTTLEALSDRIFNTLSDPTTSIETAPRAGPGLP